MWFWPKCLNRIRSVSTFFPSSSPRTKSPATRIGKGPYFYQPVSEQIFYLTSFVDFSLLHMAKFICVKSAGNLFYLRYANQNTVYFYLYARKIMSDTDTQRKHWSTEYCHWQSQGKKLTSCQYLRRTSGRGITPKDTCLKVQRCNSLSCWTKTKKKCSTCFMCQRSSLNFVFVLYLDGR